MCQGMFGGLEWGKYKHMNYYEFSMGKNGLIGNEASYKRLGPDTSKILQDYHNRNQKQELYQLTTYEDNPCYKRRRWFLWFQICAKTKEEAIEKGQSIREKIISGELSKCGYLKNGEFISEADLSHKTLWIRIHTNQIVLLLEEFNLSSLDKIKGVEVGVSIAQNSCGLLRMCPNLHLVLVDEFGDVKPPRLKDVDLRKVAFGILEEFNDRITWKIKTSLEASEEVEDGSMDFVFIDASHDYKSVKDDIEVWLPKVRDEGLLIGHDFDKKCEGLKKAVRERFGDRFSHEGSVWWIQVTEEIR
jgi:hypothetical protein